MQKTVKALVLAGAGVGLVAGSVSPAVAASTGATGTHKNVQIAKVWGTKPGKDMCWTSEKGGLVLRGCGKKAKTPTQVWTVQYVKRSGNDFIHTIRNKKSGKCLGVTSKRSGTAIKQYKCNSKNKGQQWDVQSSRFLSLYARGQVIAAPKSTAGTKMVLNKLNTSGAGDLRQEWGTK